MKKTFALLAIIAMTIVTACTFTQKIRDGKTAFERKQYAVAEKLLKKEYDKAESRVEKGKIAFLLGESYKYQNKSDASITWYETAYNNQFGYEAQREFAYALKKAERYGEAAIAFKDLGLEIGSPYEYRREISACQIAEGWKKIKNPEYKISLPDFNSGGADYAPAFYGDNTLVFTSDRKTSTGEDTYNWTGNEFSDLFKVDLSTNTVTNFDPLLNSEHNEGTITFNGDFTEAVFSRCYGEKFEDDYCKLMFTTRQNGAWSEPLPLPFQEPSINYGQPSLSKDGKTLLFVAEHPDGWGGTDIWITEKNDLGEWGEPSLMSRSINTIGNEAFPYLDEDTLYFSSDFHQGMGGLDIFKTYKLNTGGWSPAFNLKPPINSGYDDFGFIVDYTSARPKDVLQTGYFTSTRPDLGIGGDDIFKFEKRKQEEIIAVVPEEVDYKMSLDVYVLEKIYAETGNPNSAVLGRKPLDGATLKITIGQRKQNITIDESGLYSLDLADDTDYQFLAEKQGFLSSQSRFTTKGIGKDPNNPVRKFELEIVLDKVYANTEIVLENIYYDFDKWNLRTSAKATLDVLAQTLSLNPRITIELGSHTDCRGNPRYNQELSQRRAQAAVDYLISKGIDGSRLIATGFGENKLAIDCVCSQCTEEEHQINRRTTFKVIE
ncbi:MAG: OmpA family protein [Saprospiraceae bacterium]|nr:OmpA family protein [Saprospiraceae bacterium]MCB9326220.1 OmpA family protein [Lewinellaceae bacterium]